MSEKIFVLVLAIIVVSLILTPLVQAVPGVPKNSTKFQKFHYEKEVQFVDDIIFFSDHRYIPSFDKINRLIITTPSGFVNFELTIDSTTYTQGIHFDCVETFTKVYFNKPVFTYPTKLYPDYANTDGIMIDITFDFYAYSGGIEGTLQIREAAFTKSLKGTGDLQNVQVIATWAEAGFNGTTGILTIVGDGTVMGWPE